jgi:hypothetical protein
VGPPPLPLPLLAPVAGSWVGLGAVAVAVKTAAEDMLGGSGFYGSMEGWMLSKCIAARPRTDAGGLGVWSGMAGCGRRGALNESDDRNAAGSSVTVVPKVSGIRRGHASDMARYRRRRSIGTVGLRGQVVTAATTVQGAVATAGG